MQKQDLAFQFGLLGVAVCAIPAIDDLISKYIW